MAIQRDSILIVDLEATCWPGYSAPEGQHNEIIEIGACLLDWQTGSVRAPRSYLVQPIESEVSEFCTALTSITPQILSEAGMTFASACERLEQEFAAHSRIWASWGAFDRTLFLKQCKRRQQPYPFSKKHINLKRLVQDASGQRLGLARAMEHYGVSAEGTAHRGVDDAVNTARLLAQVIAVHGVEILRRHGLLYEPDKQS